MAPRCLVDRDGKRLAFEIALGCKILSTLLLFVSFVTPYWVVSWPRVHSGFKRIGLWEVCFAGFLLMADVEQKVYHGCWWTLAPEFYNIRDWLFPAYFVFLQVMVTLCFCAELLSLIKMLYLWSTANCCQYKSTANNRSTSKRDNLCLLQISLALTIFSVVGMVVSTVQFAIMVYTDHYWLPHPDLNYLSWSFGLALVSIFFSIFSSVAQLVHIRIVRREFLAPPENREVFARINKAYVSDSQINVRH